jgi:hypothetical protein
VLLRLAYLGITNAFARLRLLPGSDRYKDAEILALRHQLRVLLVGLRKRGLDVTRPILAVLDGPQPQPALPQPGPPAAPAKSNASTSSTASPTSTATPPDRSVSRMR